MRGDWFDSTGQMWINPSPNMRNLTEAALYPGIGMIEGTNISVGRGTDTPFELVGAPWIDACDARSLSECARDRRRAVCSDQLHSDRFDLCEPTMRRRLHHRDTNRDALDAPELGLEIAAALQHLYPNDYKVAALDGLMRNKATLDALTAGEDPRRIAEDWQDALEKFRRRPQRSILLY